MLEGWRNSLQTQDAIDRSLSHELETLPSTDG